MPRAHAAAGKNTSIAVEDNFRHATPTTMLLYAGRHFPAEPIDVIRLSWPPIGR